MKLCELDDLKGLSEKEAYKIYKIAVALFKEEQPGVYRQCLFTSLVGGAFGTLGGMLIKDIILAIPGLAGLLIIAFFAMLGGIVGGMVTMNRLLENSKPYFKRAREQV